MPSRQRVRLMDGETIARAIRRIADEIVSRHDGVDRLALVGIQTRGVPLARRLADELAQRGGPPPPVGVLDINLYRDDLERIAYHPVLRKTEIPFELDDAAVVLVDDVLFTGRTVRAALEALMALGRPAAVQLAVLVDRGHREVPIHADYVGLTAPTEPGDRVDVRVVPVDDADEVVLVRAQGRAKARQQERPR